MNEQATKSFLIITMALRVTSFYCFVFLLLQLEYLSSVKGQEDILECMIKDGKNEIYLNLQKTEQLLANENLPIWIARLQNGGNYPNYESVKHIRKRNFIRNNIGKFIFYHDKEKIAAFVYFAEKGTLAGVVDTRYLIVDLPINECNLGHHLGGDYVKNLRWSSYTNTDAHLKPLDLSMQASKQSENMETEPNTSTEDGPQTIFYPEIMLFIPYSITKFAKDSNHFNYLGLLVSHYIIYFNAIDMLMSKLETNNIKIRLNLAGIVIEDQEETFRFVEYRYVTSNEYRRLPYNYYVDGAETLQHASSYIIDNNEIFPQDSFDFFFIVTEIMLWSRDSKVYAAGLSSRNTCYERRRGKENLTQLAGNVVQNIYEMEYIVPSHEIAHLMSIEHDPLNKGYRDRISQCYAIMQRTDIYCLECLKWSDESIEQLKKFAKDNQNRCYLLNSPRSLHPYGSRRRTLSLSDQCRCYGFEPPILNHATDFIDINPSTFCKSIITCATSPDEGFLPIPIDGTPCADDKVCWNQSCRPIQ